MGAPKQNSYEDARQQRLDENKRRLEELGLAGLSKTISNAFKKTITAKSPSKPRSKVAVPAELLESRRSPRIAKMPAPDYKYMDEDFPRLRRSATRGASIRRRCCTFVSDKARDEAADAASSIETGHPSFVKRMLPSHVSSCFWLGLPLSFCKAHLPKSDQFMKLINENGEEWESLYLARKTGLSAGWKRFAEDNELSDGDAVLFELMEYNQFNVHIIRVASHEARDEGDEDKDDEEEDEDGEKPERGRKKLKTA